MKIKAALKEILPDVVVRYKKRYSLKKKREKEIASVSMSQAGQDYWVYGEAFNETVGGYFLDIGAHDGVYLSNTFLLEKRYAWKGLCIEANPLTFPSLLANRSCVCINKCVDNKNGKVVFSARGVWGGIVAEDCDNKDDGNARFQVQASRLDEILRGAKAPRVIDYLSIDIEGRGSGAFGFSVF